MKNGGENTYTATVTGSSSHPYSVELHIDHPRKSKCNCYHADGKRITCKHIVATYFAVRPKKAERFYAEAMAYQEEEEKRQEKLSDKVIEYVCKIKKRNCVKLSLNCYLMNPNSVWVYKRYDIHV